ncbi:MAG: alcohol dehydrogenase catalytic domain-containing protein [Hyphomicrobiales bacterium]|nr:alcohol dehydrogenase catalytic domain-containing protein [Hyphomicrobiales bacterium]MCP5370983.1 alcohol dehydrogenase catalytic domain-containing protein [Hyphomicrobiales bacterium]
MKALVYTGPGRIELQDAPDPVPDAGEVVVKVEAVGICGSDMHAYFGHDERRPAPLILGHEASGRALGGRLAGRRVVINPLVSCGSCDDCMGGRANLCAGRQIISMPPRQGAFAELVKIPETNILEIPDDMDPAHAALTEPIATALHAVGVAERALWRPLGETRTLVIGGGAVGLSAALVLASRGARDIHVADTNPGRRDTVAGSGPFTVLDPADPDVCVQNAFGLVVDAVGGGRTRAFASRAVRPGGVVVHIGLMDAGEGADIRKFTLQEVTFVGTYTYTMVDFRATVTAISEGALGDLSWVDRRALAEGAAAFDDLAQGRASASKVMLVPDL